LFSYGIVWNAGLGAFLTLLAAVVLWRWVKVE